MEIIIAECVCAHVATHFRLMVRVKILMNVPKIQQYVVQTQAVSINQDHSVVIANSEVHQALSAVVLQNIVKVAFIMMIVLQIRLVSIQNVCHHVLKVVPVDRMLFVL